MKTNAMRGGKCIVLGKHIAKCFDAEGSLVFDLTHDDYANLAHTQTAATEEETVLLPKLSLKNEGPPSATGVTAMERFVVELELPGALETSVKFILGALAEDECVVDMHSDSHGFNYKLQYSHSWRESKKLTST